MRLRCVLLLAVFGCAAGHSVPPPVRELTVLIKWPAAVSGLPPSKQLDEMAAALPEEVARVLVAEGLTVVRIEADAHDLVATASVELTPETHIDPFTTRPIKNRYHALARLAYVCGDGTAGSTQLDLHDARIELIATDAGGPLARALVRSQKVFTYAVRRTPP
ncbi:MAG TPA: hypothetical protein VLW85_09805 [Myxococcales bacterium]|nr:hypothetical protein [Myxococcales bacterium]